MNVIGSRPDGWWRDRPGAMRALARRLEELAARTGDEVTVVFDGRPFDIDAGNVGPFGIRNDHYTRDNASMSLAFALAGLAALRRPGWRVPVLAVFTLQAGFHAINHLYDIDRAHPKRDGPVDFALLTLSAVVLGWLTWRAARDERAP